MTPILRSFFVNLMRLGSETGPLITSGTGSPEGVVIAPVGSIYSRIDGGAGTAVYNKETGTGNTGWVADAPGAGGGGGTGVVGSAEIDFGAHPGSSMAKLLITGQAAIVVGSGVGAWIVAKDTVDHSADEHLLDAPRLICGAIVPGTGFTIYAMPRETRRGQLSPLNRGQRKTANTSLPYGKWAIAWRWQ